MNKQLEKFNVFETVIEALEAQNKFEKDLIKHLDIDKNTYKKYVKGEIDIDKILSKKLGDFFDVNKDYFFNLQETYKV